MVFEELGLPYEVDAIDFADLKKPEYEKVNPNGRVPAVHDPNTGLTLWESGAIIEYLVDRYDTEHKISFPHGSDDFYLAQQWLFYQVSGQGPYYGQAYWFEVYHPEKVPSAVSRYVKEIARVTGVLERGLKAQKEKAGAGGDGPWLVGNKFSYADLAFVSWQKLASRWVTTGEFNPDDYPVVKEWLAKMESRESVKKAFPEQ